MISTQQAAGRAYRTDINGMRAWAVVAVILFHFGFSGFGGGFVGVDVFFVISGFLMTQIIVGGLEKQSSGGGFSLGQFYLARARRIIPALIVLCVVLLFIGWFLLPSADYRVLGKQVRWSIGFFSNAKFFGEAGYFDVASHEKWLLHTWSLSVEWQFYLVLPLMLMAIWKLRPGRQSAAVVLGAAFIASLAMAVIGARTEPAAAFYLLLPRAWEMLAGGLAYLLSNRLSLTERSQRALELLGFALILSSVVFFSSKTVWPGAWALAPVCGAVLVLLAARPASMWTGSFAAQWLGTRSYSLYLWHWPIVVALAYVDVLQNATAVAGGLALTLALGHLSYVLVENPGRRRLGKQRASVAAVSLGLATLMAAAPATAVRSQHGFPGRLPPHVETVFDAATDINPRAKECQAHLSMPPECTYGGGKLGAIVIGDSHAASIMRAVENVLPDKSLHVLDWSMSGCPTVVPAKDIEGEGRPKSPKCPEFVNYALAKQTSLPQDAPIIILNRTSAYLVGANEQKEPGPAHTPEFLADFRTRLIDATCKFAQTRPTYLVRPIPEMKLEVPKLMGRALQMGHEREISISLDEYHQRHALAWAAQDAAAERCGVKILDPLPFLCAEGRCHGAKAGRPLYFDDDHLNEYGAAMLAPMFAEVFLNK
jgi:peptidoglycan/LPS O-acetylase OafA/YrhL